MNWGACPISFSRHGDKSRHCDKVSERSRKRLEKRMSDLTKTIDEVEKRMSNFNKTNVELEKRKSVIKTNDKLNFDRKNAPINKKLYSSQRYLNTTKMGKNFWTRKKGNLSTDGIS